MGKWKAAPYRNIPADTFFIMPGFDGFFIKVSLALLEGFREAHPRHRDTWVLARIMYRQEREGGYGTSLVLVDWNGGHPEKHQPCVRVSLRSICSDGAEVRLLLPNGLQPVVRKIKAIPHSELLLM